MDLLSALERYRPWNDQEARDRLELLRRLRSGEPLYTRDNTAAHFTVSAWVVSPDRKQVLMAFHNLYNSWAWLGSHADGSWNLQQVAEKEAAEESGIKNLKPLPGGIASLEILTVDGHEKRGEYVPSHLHLNVTYLFEGDPSLPLRCKADENSSVGWIAVEDIPIKSTEPWFVKRIYSKLTEKAAAL